jgi:N-methylhydantoinase A/oxoprolinase/acetone carboxylase beta subunit
MTWFTRLTIDIGRTFTDLVLALPDRALSFKSLTTHDALDPAVTERERTALIATMDFRDTSEIAYEHRIAQYDLYMERHEPLVCRNLRPEAAERLAQCRGIRTNPQGALPRLSTR